MAIVAARGIQTAAFYARHWWTVIFGFLLKIITIHFKYFKYLWYVSIDTYLTQRPEIANRADAFELSDHVNALAAISTWWCGTLVYVCLTILARITYCTRTVIVVDQVNAGGTVLALPIAIVQILSARRPTPSLLAATGERTGRVMAIVRIDAWTQCRGSVWFALVQIGLTYVTCPFGWTLATKPTDKVDAGAAMLARTISTFIDVCKERMRNIWLHTSDF